MERTEVLDMMGALTLYGMKAADLPLKFHPVAIRASGVCMP